MKQFAAVLITALFILNLAGCTAGTGSSSNLSGSSPIASSAPGAEAANHSENVEGHAPSSSGNIAGNEEALPAFGFTVEEFVSRADAAARAQELPGYYQYEYTVEEYEDEETGAMLRHYNYTIAEGLETGFYALAETDSALCVYITRNQDTASEETDYLLGCFLSMVLSALEGENAAHVADFINQMEATNYVLGESTAYFVYMEPPIISIEATPY